MNSLSRFAMLMLLCASGLTGAAEPVLPAATSTVVVPLAGQDTETWLTLQREGVQASLHSQSLPAAYHERAAQRFMKTLDQAIPATSMAQGNQ